MAVSSMHERLAAQELKGTRAANDVEAIYELITEVQETQGGHTAQLNKLQKTQRGHTVQLDELAQTQRGHTVQLDELAQTQRGHTVQLDELAQTQRGHTATLGRLDERLGQLDGKLDLVLDRLPG